ncbi:PrgI family protein [Amycolatopsis aidingensis]|uniref:PrgI family protein n=1 Tax=Amycolatopsis aidingensis TaxID=2842453 RepID=UPI001C0C2CAF|nr:PrgI family protein [Amycolatopsis aidingensis]
MSHPVRVPADVDRPDRVLGPLTARQLAILGIAGLVLYGLYTLTHPVVPLPVFLIVAVPVGISVAVLALGQRDGMTLDRLLLAAIRQRLAPRRRVAAPDGVRAAPPWLTDDHTTDDRAGGHRAGQRARAEGVAPAPLELPATGVSETGVVDLGADGLAVIAACSTVNFSLRTPGEQEALVASFARYLHSLTAPVQILVRAERLDLTPQIAELHHRAGGLPHPALEAAARDHADYLAELTGQTDLLRRQVLLVLREPVRTGPGTGAPPRVPWGRRVAPTEVDTAARHAAEQRLVRRLHEAVELLSPAGVVVTALDASAATGVLAAACNPDTYLPPSAALAGADEVITSTTTVTDLYGPDDATGSPRVRSGSATSPPAEGEPETPSVRFTVPTRHAAASGAGPWLRDDEDWDYDDELTDDEDR